VANISSPPVGDDAARSLEEAIGRYNDAWNDHDLDAIMSMHATDMVFENHTAGESPRGSGAGPHRHDLRDLATTSTSRPAGCTSATEW
jgi:hypothetical protein